MTYPLTLEYYLSIKVNIYEKLTLNMVITYNFDQKWRIKLYVKWFYQVLYVMFKTEDLKMF